MSSGFSDAARTTYAFTSLPDCMNLIVMEAVYGEACKRVTPWNCTVIVDSPFSVARTTLYGRRISCSMSVHTDHLSSPAVCLLK